MTTPTSLRWDFEIRLLAWLAVSVSVFAFLFYYRSGDILLYGDAEAHINIARRVFDSKTPGPLQLGTVWLPLPHLLMIPFLVSDRLWQTGVGGSLPSLIAYVFGVIGVFRLVRESVARDAGALAAWIAAGIFAANPNLIYLQCTAMGETVYLAFFVWAVVYFAEFVRGEDDGHSLTKCGLCVAAACLTRYDGWFLAAAMVLALLVFRIVNKNHPHLADTAAGSERARQAPRGQLTGFLFLAVAVPLLWLAYNAIIYRNPLEFENGPYSAKAIELRSVNAGVSSHPGAGNFYVSALYFVKSAEVNMADNPWLGRAWLLLALCAAAASLFFVVRKRGAARSSWPLLLLGIPLPFYALSMAYAGVPIYVPDWSPFGYYNVRYGLQLLPAFAIAAGLLISITAQVKFSQAPQSTTVGKIFSAIPPRALAVLLVLALAVFSYASVWQSTPICLREAQANMRGRAALETQLSKWLDGLPPDSTLLMYLGGFPGTLERAAIPLKRVVNEGNHRVWKQPKDPEGLWERALADPARFADYAIAFEGDPVWQAVQPRHMNEIVEIKVTDQPRAVIYRVR
ncbi:MAG TPA: glycosyltransferase family 39 protein [Candidatus Sulfotelmatobacter sp.]|nr:glycosyltransferase family 39 protein [Candidatus Sulfotelmatobacter sp.]